MSLLNIAGSIHTKKSLLETIRQSVPSDGRKVHTMGPLFPHPGCIRKGVICVLCRGQWAKKVVHRNRPRQDTAPGTSPSHLLQWPWLAILPPSNNTIILQIYQKAQSINMSEHLWSNGLWKCPQRHTQGNLHPSKLTLQSNCSRLLFKYCDKDSVLATVLLLWRDTLTMAALTKECT